MFNPNKKHTAYVIQFKIVLDSNDEYDFVGKSMNALDYYFTIVDKTVIVSTEDGIIFSINGFTKLQVLNHNKSFENKFKKEFVDFLEFNGFFDNNDDVEYTIKNANEINYECLANQYVSTYSYYADDDVWDWDEELPFGYYDLEDYI